MFEKKNPTPDPFSALCRHLHSNFLHVDLYPKLLTSLPVGMRTSRMARICCSASDANFLHLHFLFVLFRVEYRSAEMPTRCASVNYCGTQAPIWLHLEDDQKLPEASQQVQLTACSSWSHQQDSLDGSIPQYDCCAMKYPVSVRNCSNYLIYRLQPTEACNMAYCAQVPLTSGTLA